LAFSNFSLSRPEKSIAVIVLIIHSSPVSKSRIDNGTSFSASFAAFARRARVFAAVEEEARLY